MNPVQEFQTQKAMMLKQIHQQEMCVSQAKNQDDLNFCQPKKEKCEKERERAREEGNKTKKKLCSIVTTHNADV